MMIEAKGKLTAKDIVTANWVRIKPRPAFAVLGMFLYSLGLFFAFGPWLGIIRGGPPKNFSDFFGIGFSVCVPLYFLVYIPLYARYLLKHSNSLRRDQTLRFSMDDIEIGGLDDTSLKMPWADISKWKEGNGLFLLFFSPHSFVVLPIRYFASNTAVDELRALLIDKVRRAA